MNDPGRDALGALWRLAWAQGFIAGLNKRGVGSCTRCFILGVLTVTLMLMGWAWAQTIPPGAEKYRHELTRQARSIWGMDAPISSLAAQLHQESSWNEAARSYVGAAGLAQFMRSTAADMADRYPELQPANVFDPKWAIRAQNLYMRELWAAFPNARNHCERAAFALGAYNGGTGWMRKRQSLSESPERCLGATCEINPGIKDSNQKENRDYSRRILLSLTPLYYNALWGPGWCMSYTKGP